MYVCFVVYLTTLFQYLRLYSVDFYSILIHLPSCSEAGETRVRNMAAEFCRRVPIVLVGFFNMPWIKCLNEDDLFAWIWHTKCPWKMWPNFCRSLMKRFSAKELHMPFVGCWKPICTVLDSYRVTDIQNEDGEINCQSWISYSIDTVLTYLLSENG
jgi:hypothetical protein